MERQALGDAVVRYNTEGLTGLYDRAKLERQTALAAPIVRDPDPGGDAGGSVA